MNFYGINLPIFLFFCYLLLFLLFSAIFALVSLIERNEKKSGIFNRNRPILLSLPMENFPIHKTTLMFSVKNAKNART